MTPRNKFIVPFKLGQWVPSETKSAQPGPWWAPGTATVTFIMEAAFWPNYPARGAAFTWWDGIGTTRTYPRPHPHLLLCFQANVVVVIVVVDVVRGLAVDVALIAP